jgi:hypothetical protein
MRASFWVLGVIVVAVLAPFGCGGGGGDKSTFVDDGGSTGFGGDANLGDVSLVTPIFGGDGGSRDGASINPDAQGVFAITPAGVQTITVAAGQSAPTVSFTATLSGSPVNAGWNVDRGDLGTVTAGPSSTSTFTPSGATGGMVTVTAGFSGKIATAQVFIKLTAHQSGANPSNAGEALQIATSPAQLTAGGGVGGVGGEGLGGPVTDGPTLSALGTPSGDGSAQGLTFIYPYDKTVWPRGMLAPLLMWQWSYGDADAIQISLTTTSGSFSWTGTFDRPTILTTGQDFIRHPIPQDVWAMATNTAGGPTPSGKPDDLTVSLTVAKAVTNDGSSTEVGFGPISETWPVAPGGLPGIIYYNSYGTQLALNSGGAVGGNNMFGAAVLSIHVGDTGPQLVAGTNGGSAQCRVCHSVAAGGSRLIVQHGDNNDVTSSEYDLTTAGAVETVLATNSAYFPGMYPDGSMALTEPGQILPLPNDSVLPTVNGLSAVATDVGTPSFSPDGTLVAFNPMAGPGVTTPTQQVWVMAFNAATLTFSAPTLVADDTGQPAQTRPGWPAFFPDGKSLVYHQQTVAGSDGNSNGALYTRKGCKAQIAWTSATDATHVTPLNELNGMDSTGHVYLPQLPQPISLTCTGDGVQVGGINPSHEDDVDLNYEPTVNPEASGGYVWVVFTSRRMYGNEATIPPFCSDPRGVDLIKNITTKKLWVAAVDLGATPGTDASHPAFYLPGQELLAGNSRGFWVLDPCRSDGQSCQSGDQCCNGYCEPQGDGGALICANTPPNNACSVLNNKCTMAADCCVSTNQCVNGFCTQSSIPQ